MHVSIQSIHVCVHVLYCIVLHCIALYCIVLYCTVTSCPVVSCRVMSCHQCKYVRMCVCVCMCIYACVCICMYIYCICTCHITIPNIFYIYICVCVYIYIYNYYIITIPFRVQPNCHSQHLAQHRCLQKLQRLMLSDLKPIPQFLAAAVTSLAGMFHQNSSKTGYLTKSKS